MARGLAAAGVLPVILDINEAAARQTALEITEETGAKSYGYMANVLDKASLEEIQKQMISKAVLSELFQFSCSLG